MRAVYSRGMPPDVSRGKGTVAPNNTLCTGKSWVTETRQDYCGACPSSAHTPLSDLAAGRLTSMSRDEQARLLMALKVCTLWYMPPSRKEQPGEADRQVAGRGVTGGEMTRRRGQVGTCAGEHERHWAQLRAPPWTCRALASYCYQHTSGLSPICCIP